MGDSHIVASALWTLAVLGLVLPPGVPQRGLKLCRLLGWNKWFSLSLFLWEREMKTDHGPGQWVREVVAAPSSTIGHQQVFGWSSGGQSWARSLCSFFL